VISLEELRREVEAGAVDTVALAVCDMQGRLQGKRFAARHFLDTVVEAGTEACSYLLASDVEMNTVDGFDLTSWERGYGDFELVPDLSTLRLLPWSAGTAFCLADVRHGGAPIAVAPRTILAGQLRRLAERGWIANAATELEFIAFAETYRDAWTRGYENLEPAILYNGDYSLLDTGGLERLIRAIRLGMEGAGLEVESSKGECNLGQQEIAFHYGDALRTADDHVLYKTGAKEIAAQHDMAVTFMAKYDAAEGNSCHVHLSLADAEGAPLFHRDRRLFDSFLAGQIACLRDFSLLFAPNVNSYKRFRSGSFAPTAIAWGRDNRTCALRVVGHGRSLRFENRVPGADVNPYLALAAMIAAGLHGVDEGLELEPECAGNAYLGDRPRIASSLPEAQRFLADSDVARATLGEEVVKHYLNAAEIEIDAFAATVTGWERRRGFERL
jgi:glutamine synthetase